MTNVFIKKERCGHRHTYRENAIWIPAKECQRLPANHRKPGEKHKIEVFSEPPKRTSPADTSILLFQKPPELWDNQFPLFKPPVCVTLLWQPQQINTVSLVQLLRLEHVVLNKGILTPARSICRVWRHFLLLWQLGGATGIWYIRSHGCCSTFCNTQSPTTRNYVAQKVNSAEMETQKSSFNDTEAEAQRV